MACAQGPMGTGPSDAVTVGRWDEPSTWVPGVRDLAPGTRRLRRSGR